MSGWVMQEPTANAKIMMVNFLIRIQIKLHRGDAEARPYRTARSGGFPDSLFTLLRLFFFLPPQVVPSLLKDDLEFINS